MNEIKKKGDEKIVGQDKDVLIWRKEILLRKDF